MRCTSSLNRGTMPAASLAEKFCHDRNSAVWNVRWRPRVVDRVQQGGSTDGASPTTTPSASTSPPPPFFDPRVFPPLSGPSNTYVFSGELERPVTHYTAASQYVLYENGAFSFQYLTLGAKMVGAYLLQDGRISFVFSGGGDASGTLNGDVLEIVSDRMVQSDFENAVYKRAQ